MGYVARRTEGGPLLALTFHGTGGDESQFHDLARDLLPGATIVSPRGDVSEMGALRYFRRTGEGVYDMADLARRTEAMGAFVADERRKAGASRVLALGYSNGANILAAVAMRQPELVDDLVLLHPLIPWDPEPQPGLSGRRVLITAGRRDPICPAPMTERFANWLRTQGADVTLAWHPGGHEIARTEIDAIRDFLAPVSA